MRIVFDVKQNSNCALGLTPWNTGVGKPPAKTWRADLTFFFYAGDESDNCDVIEFTGNSANMLQLLERALSMLKFNDEAYAKEVAEEKPPTERFLP